MAGIYVVFTLAMAVIFWGQRKVAIGLVLAGLALSLLMLWHHATSILQINW